MMKHHTFKNVVVGTLIASGTVTLLGILVLWGWNVVVPEIFEAPAIKFKHALGLVFLGLAASCVLRFNPMLLKTRRSA